MTRNLGIRAEQFSAKRFALHVPRQPWLAGFARWGKRRRPSWQAKVRENATDDEWVGDVCE